MNHKLMFSSALIVLFLLGNIANAQDNKDSRWSPNASSRVNVLGAYTDLPSNYQHPVTTTRIEKTDNGNMLIPPNFRPYPSTVTESECTIVTQGGNQNMMFAGWNSIGLPSTFYSTGWGLTTNGGTSWTGNVTTVGNYGDPGPWIWSTGSAYPGRLGISFITLAGSMGASYSTDNGTTWSAALTFPGATTSADKNLSAVDDVPGSPFLGRAYTVYTEFGGTYVNRIVLSYTSNGGVSWSTVAPVSPTPSSGHHCQGCDVAVGPGGVVYVTWAHCTTNGQNSTEDNLGFARSTDGGVTWASTSNNVVDVNGIRTANMLNGIRCSGFPRIAVDKSGGSRNGYIYITLCEKTVAPARDGGDVTLCKSTDAGATWTHTLVNGDAAGKLQWHSAVAVNLLNGDLGISYFDQRNTSATDAQYYVSYSNNGGTSFVDFQASDHTFTPDYLHSASVAAGYAGDYSGITWSNNKMYPLWNDETISPSTDLHQVWSCALSPVLLTHDYAVGPWMNLPVSPLLINTNYTFKVKVSNLGTSAESTVPVKWYVDGSLIATTNISLAAGGVDSVANVYNTAVAGVHNLMYIAALGTDLDRTNDTIRTSVNMLASLPPLCEEFSTATFPPTSWTVSGTYWGYNAVSGFGVGTGSARYNMWTASSGTNEDLKTLTFPATTNPAALLYVDMAFAPYPSTAPYNQDSLVIQASTNGGSTWISLARLGPTQLATAPAGSSQFVPTASQWVKRSYTLPVGTNKIDFLGKSAFGNDLFLDSICVNNLVGITHNGNTVPQIFALDQNYPNPFNPTTNITFALPKASFVKLVVYDILGKVVETLVNEQKDAGLYKVDFNASKIASGVYFYRIEAGDFTDVKKMLLVK
jgi:hypothetical protein